MSRIRVRSLTIRGVTSPFGPCQPPVSPTCISLPRTLPAEARVLLAEPLDADDELEDLSRILLRGATTQLEAVERVVAWVSKRIRYESPSLLEESAASCHRSRRGSCVGPSRHAAGHERGVRHSFLGRQIQAWLNFSSIL